MQNIGFPQVKVPPPPPRQLNFEGELGVTQSTKQAITQNYNFSSDPKEYGNEEWLQAPNTDLSQIQRPNNSFAADYTQPKDRFGNSSNVQLLPTLNIRGTNANQTLAPQYQMIGQGGGKSTTLGCLIKNIILDSFNNVDTIIHKQRQIVRLPDSKELKLRLISPLWANYVGTFDRRTPLQPDDILVAMLSNHWKHITESKRDFYLDVLGFTSSKHDEIFEKWDEQVYKIRDALLLLQSSNTFKFSKDNIITPPHATPNLLSKLDSTTRKNLMNRNADNARYILLNQQRPLSKISVNVTPPTNNLGAPLYPKLVMNGGSHPFAGGEPATNYVGTLVNEKEINLLIDQFQRLSGSKNIDKNVVVDKTKKLMKKIVNDAVELNRLKNLLQDINYKMGREPFGAGFDPENFTEEQMKNIQKKYNDLHKKYTTRNIDLLTIQDLLTRYNDQHTPVFVSRM